MSETTYFQLTKPGLDEPISPDPYNGNFDIIDKIATLLFGIPTSLFNI